MARTLALSVNPRFRLAELYAVPLERTGTRGPRAYHHCGHGGAPGGGGLARRSATPMTAVVDNALRHARSKFGGSRCGRARYGSQHSAHLPLIYRQFQETSSTAKDPGSDANPPSPVACGFPSAR